MKVQKSQKAIPNRLNTQVLTAEEAQSEIREAVKNAIFYRKSKSEIDRTVRTIIIRAISSIAIPSLKNAVYRSLVAYYNRQRQIAAEIPAKSLFLFLALTRLTEQYVEAEARCPYVTKISLSEARDIVRGELPELISDEVINLGQALRKYHRNYLKENIMPTLERMAAEEALDPDSEKYWDKRSTLRNRAEREVRWQEHIDNRAELEAKGVKLVIVSAHADCSERCRPWQGRVYSLDGTSGTTSDGREYVPLEKATDIWTKDGKWKNGLFGFNCRHYMVEYKDGYSFPMTSKKEEEQQYKISQKQRYMERQVRHWHTVAEMARGVDNDRYEFAKAKAKGYNKRYIKYSKANSRAYFVTRTRII